MDCTLPSKKMLQLEFPFNRMQNSLMQLGRLKELAALSSHKSKGKMALDWLQTNRELVQETLSRGGEPYYAELPYRNRSDGSASWQHRILWDAPTFKGRVACGANRIGKSRLGAFETALMVTGEHPRYKSPAEGRAWIVGPDSKVIEGVEKPYFEKFIPKRYFENGKWNGKHQYWKLKADGREWEVWFKSVDSGRAKFQGDAIDYAWIDEEPLKDGVFTELEMRMLDRSAIWLMTATPVEGTKWLKDTLGRQDVGYTMAGMWENPYIPLREIEEKIKTLPDDERQVRIEGKYIIFGGRPIFNRELIADMEARAMPHTDGILMKKAS